MINKRCGNCAKGVQNLITSMVDCVRPGNILLTSSPWCEGCVFWEQKESERP